jgi:negative regulator of sigma E activity
MSTMLSQVELEELSAYMDGELDAPRAAEVRRRIESDPAWRQAHAELSALDAAMDACDVPAAPTDLADRIVSQIRRRTDRAVTIRIATWAAAAAVLLAVGISLWMAANDRNSDNQTPVVNTSVPGGSGNAVTPGPGETGRAEPGLIPPTDVEELARDNLDFFKNLDVITNLDTLEEIERLEIHESGT